MRVKEEEDEQKQRVLAKALLEAVLAKPDEEEEGEERVVKEEDQKSLSVGIIGAPNAGKSCLTNYMVRSNISFGLNAAFLILTSFFYINLQAYSNFSH